METIDYTIGDDIVCIQTHSLKKVIEGKTYVALGLKEHPCKTCSKDTPFLVNVGIVDDMPVGTNYTLCASNHKINRVSDGIWWINAYSFKKLDTLMNISELTEVLEKPAFS